MPTKLANRSLKRLGCERGQTLVEYSLILLFVAVALVGAMQLFQVSLGNYYDTIVNVVSSAVP